MLSKELCQIYYTELSLNYYFLEDENIHSGDIFRTMIVTAVDVIKIETIDINIIHV